MGLNASRCLSIFRTGRFCLCQESGAPYSAIYYQMVRTPELWMALSRLRSGSPKCKAVAAIMRSGMSGTWERGMYRTVSATPGVRAKRTKPHLSLDILSWKVAPHLATCLCDVLLCDFLPAPESAQ